MKNLQRGQKISNKRKIKQKKTQRLLAEKKRKTILKNEKLTLNGGYCEGYLQI